MRRVSGQVLLRRAVEILTVASCAQAHPSPSRPQQVLGTAAVTSDMLM